MIREGSYVPFRRPETPLEHLAADLERMTESKSGIGHDLFVLMVSQALRMDPAMNLSGWLAEHKTSREQVLEFCDLIRDPGPDGHPNDVDCHAAAVTVRAKLLDEQPPAAKPGRPKKEKVDDINISAKGGTDPTYLLARLKRDRPDLAQQIIDGTLTPNKAAIQAGIRHPRASIRTDSIEAALTTLLRHYSEDQIRAALDDL